MPVPASEAIASDVGHGRFGLRTGLRPFEELLSESAGQRHVWAELRPVKFLNATWTAGASSTYRHDLSESHDGVLLWPRGVVTDQETLSPVDSLANCEAMAGTFWYDVVNGRLWVHLLGNADPANRKLVAQLGVPVGSHGVFQPWLGAQRLLNRGLEEWTGSTPDDFTVGSSGSGVTLDKTTDALEGTYAARFTATAAPSGDYRYFRQAVTNEATGERYRFSGAYRISQTAGSLVLRLFVEDATTSVEADGVSVAGSVAHFAELGDTAGQWRRFSFDLLMPTFAGDPAIQLRAYSGAASTSGTVDVDDLRLEHAPRMAYYYPKLGLEGVPHVEQARADSLYGQISTGLGSLTLLNGGGFWESLFAALDWTNAEVVIRLGGRFPEGGDEVPLEDCPIYVRGRVAHPTIEDARVVLELSDQRNILQELLPLTTFDSDTYPKLKPRDHGRPRALMLGYSDTTSNPIGAMRPTQVDETSVGFGIYETCDPSYTSAGDEGEDVYAYVDEQSADKEDPTKRVLLVPNAGLGGPDYSKDPRDGTGQGRITILKHVAPVVITERNRTIDFDVGGAELHVSMGYGNWRLPYLLLVLQNGMNSAAGVGNITVTYNLATHKVEIDRTSGTLNLRTATGTNRDISYWPELGFDVGGSDRTGGGPYVSDNPLFTDTDQHIIRYDETLGVCDDAAGTYTGTAFRWLTYASEIAHYLLGAVFKVPTEELDVASFVQARTDSRHRQSAFYFSPQDNPVTFGEVLERIETAAGADVRIVDGRWTWVWRSSQAETDVVDLVDSDYLAFSGSYEEEDIYEIVVVALTPNPISGRYRTAQKTDSAVRVRFGQKGQRTFFTTLHNLAEVTDWPAGGWTPRLVELLDEAQTKRRRFRFSVKGKALLRPVGSQIRLTRAKGLDSTGALDKVLCRIIRKRDDVLRWRSDIEAIELPLFKDFWILGVTGHSELGVATKLSH